MGTDTYSGLKKKDSFFSRLKQRLQEMKPTFTRKGLIAIACIIAVLALLLVIAGIPMLQFVSDKEALYAYLHSHGLRGTVLFVMMVVLQTLSTVIPDGPFQLAAGFVYGAFPGAVLIALSVALGNTISFLIGKRYGRRFFNQFFTPDQIRKADVLLESDRSQKLFFWIMLIPGTPKDLFAYLAGLTEMKAWQVFLTVAVCRFPATFLSTYSGAKLGEKNYSAFLLMLVAMALIYVIVAQVMKRYKKKHPEIKRITD